MSRLNILILIPERKLYAKVIVALFAVLIYVNTLGHGFVFDDQAVLNQNVYVTQGISGVDEIFTTGSWSGFNPERDLRIYRPLQLTVLAIQYEFFGDSPFGYHLFHVLSYALLCVLVLVLMRKLLANYQKGALIAFLATLFFTLHPVHTEVVANIKGNGDLLAMLFGVITLIFVEKFGSGGRYRYIAIGSVALLIALLFKETVITVIGVAVLMLYYFSDLSIRKITLAILPLLLPVAIYLAARSFVFDGSANSLDGTTTNISNVILLADGWSQEIGLRMYALGKNLQLLAFPYPLLMMYVHDSIPMVEAYEMESLFPFVLYTIITLVFFAGIKSRSLLSFAAGAYLATIFLFSNIIFSIPNIISERWLLLPSLAFCLALALTLVKLSAHYKWTAIALTSLICFGYTGYTIQRNLAWQSDLTLSTTDLRTAPSNYSALRMAASELLKEARRDSMNQKMLRDSANYFEQTLRITPDDYERRNSLGITYELLGEYDLAAFAFGKVIQYDSKVKDKARYSYAKNLVSAGNHFKALSALENLEKDYPAHAGVSALKGKSLFATGKQKEGLAAYTKSLKLNPNDPQANEGLAIYYLDLAKANNLNAGLLKKSVGHHVKWLSNLQQPSKERSLGYNRLGQIYEQLKMHQKAADAFGMATEYPSSIQGKAAFSQAKNLSLIGNYTEALPYWQALKSKFPSNIDVHVQLADTQTALNQPQEAAENYQAALSMIQNLEDPTPYNSILTKIKKLLNPQ